MSSQFNRRDFLKLSLAGIFSMGMSRIPLSRRKIKSAQDYLWLGRTVMSLRYYDQPSVNARELGYYVTDAVIKIYESKLGDPEPKNNPIWVRTDDGWVHSSWVQPVKDEPATPIMDVPAEGFLGEVCVPFTQSWENNQGVLKRTKRFYYASTHWITMASTDSMGTPWYQIVDDLGGGFRYVMAEHVRQVTAEEVAPITPEVKDKYVLVDLAQQLLKAYENGRVVFTARCSTGTFAGDTPLGEFKVERKQPSRHMAADEERGNGFDLPGVPWVSFIAWTGVSMHGTYWHNDYGTPRSHGCINLTPAAAKWIYRWSTPNVPFNDDYVEADEGTRVVVV